MFKKLRNKMLIMNMVSTFFLIILAFSAIFTITYNNVEHDIDEALFRAFSFHRPFKMPQNIEQEIPKEEKKPQRMLRDMRIFSVYIEPDKTVKTDSVFGENSEYYKSVAKAALRQNSLEGEFKSEGIVWRFDTRKLENGARIIALANISAEKNFLFHLIISLSASAAVLLIIIFILSLHFANRALKPVKEAWDKQKQFVEDASHELKTPLAAINTNIDLLLSLKENEEKERGKWLRYIKNEVSRLTSLTENLLFMARMNGEVKTTMQRVNASETIESCILNFEAVAFEKGIALKENIEKEIFLSNSNEAQLSRLCLILLDNAVKYSEKNGTVKVSFKTDGSKNAFLSVHNYSEPIAKEDLAKIFDRFYRGDKSRSSEGYGLGLAMAKEITQLHKGKISVKSSREEGTEFIVQLPL